MSRLMSVAFTEHAVRRRTKTVTRRKGWLFAKPGDRITLCRKVMGRKPGEPLERIVDVELVDVRRESLFLLTDLDGDRGYAHAEMEREGFPGMDPGAFVLQFFTKAQGIGPADEVTRIEWRYLDHESDCLCRRCGESRHRECIWASAARADPHPDHRIPECPTSVEPVLGDVATCRTCRRRIVFEVVVEPGYNPRTGWSDGWAEDALVCFRAHHYRHVPDRWPAVAS